MKITIVMGFFLPVPPDAGGATEKTWHRLAREFVAQGHHVTIVSRKWKHWPTREVRDGIDHLRVASYDHRRQLWRNLCLDAWWSMRVVRHLPRADITVVHAVTLPMFLGAIRPRAGKVVVMPGRMPKGQYRWYRKIGCVLAASTPVRTRVVTENPALAPATVVRGYPLDWHELAAPRSTSSNREILVGFIGRLNREKGLDLLAAAAGLLAQDRGLPPWRLMLCGPSNVAAGGSGPRYRAELEQTLGRMLPPGAVTFAEPVYDALALAKRYQQIDIFCYPSVATEGETFGVAVAEAMAAGAAPVVSQLECFRDYIMDGKNGLSFDHTASDAAHRLAQALRRLIVDSVLREQLATQAQSDVRRYDYAVYAETILNDFAGVIPPSTSSRLVAGSA